MLEVPRILLRLGFNRRPLAFDDFLRACDTLSIVVQRAHVKTAGMYFECRGRQVITLSSRLQGVQLYRVAFHELAHSQLHAPGLRCFSPRSVSKAESEADDIALACVIPETMLYRIIADGQLHDFPLKMIAARIEVAERRLM